MRPDASDLVTGITNIALRACRVPPLNRSRVYALLGTPPLQPVLERIAGHRAVVAFRGAQKRCPAYEKFLRAESWAGRVRCSNFDAVPETTKQNYVRPYSIEERCFGGHIPRSGVVIDESSGSSGKPNNWVRGPQERAGVQRLLEHGLTLRFKDTPVFLINCFALGPWATGMNVSMSLAKRCIVKSVGPDRGKLEDTLRTFGTGYEYAIAGYPPFIKDFLDASDVDLSRYTMHLLVGGEGITEPLRDRFLERFQSVYSSYGASDLEINIAAETPLSIAIRRLCATEAELSRKVFDRSEPPMLFQYNPLDYLIETNTNSELVFTLLRPGYAAPKIRYNLRDVGGVMTWREMRNRLREHRADVDSLPRVPAFPFLFIAGRSDLTVAFYGAKIFTTDMDAVLVGDRELGGRFRSFQMRVSHDEDQNERLEVHLERSARAEGDIDPECVRRTIVEGLCRVNRDFREVRAMFDESRVRVEIHPCGSGPFADQDIRVKQKYVG